jgi:hypothetical protein
VVVTDPAAGPGPLSLSLKTSDGKDITLHDSAGAIPIGATLPHQHLMKIYQCVPDSDPI